MADQPSIFNEQNSEATPPNNDSSTVTAPNESELTDLLSGIKNERGEPKYKTLKDAIIGLQHAQTYIPELKGNLTAKEREIEELRVKANKVVELENAVRDLTERSSNQGTPPQPLTQQEIAAMVNQSLDETLTNRERIAIQKNNIETVVASLKESFGADAEKKFNEKASELGMSVAEFNTLAAKSPKIVLSALGVQNRQTTQSGAPSQGTVNSQAFTPRSDTYVGRNNKTALVGATTQEVLEESRNTNKMVDELHKAGKSVGDLSNPKEYAKYFGKT